MIRHDPAFVSPIVRSYVVLSPGLLLAYMVALN